MNCLPLRKANTRSGKGDQNQLSTAGSAQQMQVLHTENTIVSFEWPINTSNVDFYYSDTNLA